MKSKFKKLLELFFIFVFLIQASGTLYLFSFLLKKEKITEYIFNEDKVSKILDDEGKVVKELHITKENNITYSQLPDIFINALVSSEDARFFSHSGIDLQRIIYSLANNILGNSLQGGSTLTQQLIKNTLLDSSKTLDRKLNEIILSLNLENKLTKEDILEAYCNNISFDGTTLGVNNASNKFFNKHIKDVTLPEAALLAGIVNAPTLYNPIRNPDNAKERMDTVLYLMNRHGYISNEELEVAKRVNISDMLKESPKQEISYDYQAYLDIVYNETMEILQDSYLTRPLIIETALNTKAQSLIDEIQKGNIISFSDDNQQFALSLIDNQTGALVASMGGRNYEGELLFNRSYSMKRQPASSIKPLLSYALGIEVLNYNSKQVLLDIPYSYSNGVNVNNVDLTYKGELLIEDAIGYSRNTTALSTLNEVINNKGLNYVTDYLSSINLLDVPPNEFTQSYALGGYKYGVSPQNLASAYSMIANKGHYKEAYTITKIIDASNNKVLYINKNNAKKVLEESSTDILTSILENVVKNNYYGLGSLYIKDVPLYIKSGTSSFDKSTLKKYNYPNNASKDLWIAGFSKEFSFAIWTGFDSPKSNQKNYFSSGTDQRKSYHKEILKLLLEKATTKKGNLELTGNVSMVNIVKGTNLLPDEYTPSYLITTAYFKKGYEPSKTISPLPLNEISSISLFMYDDKLNVVFDDYLLTNIEKDNSIYSNSKAYGNIEYIIEINNDIYISDTQDFYIDFNEPIYKLKGYTRYKNAPNITSNVYERNFTFF